MTITIVEATISGDGCRLLTIALAELRRFVANRGNATATLMI